MTEEKRRNLQERWKGVLGHQRLRELFVRAYSARFDHVRFDPAKPVTLVAVAASTLMGPIAAPTDSAHPTVRISPNDILIVRQPAMDVPEGPTVFMNIIGGTASGPIGLPLHIFLFGDRGHALQGQIDGDGNWASLS